jgi:hypothetical protein
VTLSGHIRQALAVGFVLAASAVLVADCPPINKKGLRPGMLYRFQFVGTWGSEADCVRSAFNQWQTSDGASGLNTSFTEGAPAQITLSKTALANGVAGGTTVPTTDDNGYIIGFGIQFTTNTNYLESCDGYHKVGVHELGHGHGLGDASGTQGSSVMNQFSGKDDVGGNVASSPTDCDASQARQASPDPDPPPDCSFDIGTHPPPCGSGEDLDGYGCCYQTGTPILVDTNHNGFTLSSPQDGVAFDLDGSGRRDRRYSWPVDADDMWLVLDRNNNGTIDDGRELFGNHTQLADGTFAANGYIALAELDDNGDAVIDQRDAAFAHLRLWSDRNRNGTSEPGELFTLSDKGVASLSLHYSMSRRSDRWGNTLRYRADVWFIAKPFLRQSVDVVLKSIYSRQ